MPRLALWIIIAAASFFSASAFATSTSVTKSEDFTIVYVIDVGAGLCTVTVTPDYKYMVYDAGGTIYSSNQCFKAIKKLIPNDHPIDLLIISHTDGDHLYNADDILGSYRVKKIIRTGNFSKRNLNPSPSCPYNSNSWCEFNKAVANEVATEQATDVNLQTTTIPPGFVFPLGNATVTFIAGWPKWDAEELAGQFPNLNSSDLDVSDSSEIQNANSIVVRLDYKGGSVLFTGDTIGRKIGGEQSEIKAAELIMVHRNMSVSINSDVVLAPHHGGDNGSSMRFIEHVSPKWVIFAAGNKHSHPCISTVGRYQSYDSSIKIFRTDYGGIKETSNNCCEEWHTDNNATEKDFIGDDNVKIELKSNGDVTVEYCEKFVDQSVSATTGKFCNPYKNRN